MAVTEGAPEQVPADRLADPPRFLANLASRTMRVVWAWPALLAFLAGCYQLTGPELWRDELSSWTFASRPVPELVTIVHHTDATQLGYYMLLHYWISAFGDSVIAMRLLSVLAMAGAAACVTLIGRRLADSRVGLLGGLVFALVPSISRFAQETRFYALEVLVAMAATLLLLRALDRPTLRRWVAYAACLAVLGYLDLVALALIAGHAAVWAWEIWQAASAASGASAAKEGLGGRIPPDGDSPGGRPPGKTPQTLLFVPAVLVGCAACLPIALVGLGQAGTQLEWLPRPGFSLSTFSSFEWNLFYSTAAAAALIIVAVFAWAVARRPAAFATSIALLPVAAVWLLSQGAHSYFFPRYLLFTVGGWAVLAGLALSRLDVRVAAAVVLVFGILGAGDQRMVREAGAHTWAPYPLNTTTDYWDFAGAARLIARDARVGDGIAYPGEPIRWEMIDYGVQYYLNRDLPAGRVPREVFVARTAAAVGSLYPVLCSDAAACLGSTPRMWIVGDRYSKNPYADIPAAEAAEMRAHFHRIMIRHVDRLTIFLLIRT